MHVALGVVVEAEVVGAGEGGLLAGLTAVEGGGGVAEVAEDGGGEVRVRGDGGHEDVGVVQVVVRDGIPVGGTRAVVAVFVVGAGCEPGEGGRQVSQTFQEEVLW